jgi:hypothetical protein
VGLQQSASPTIKAPQIFSPNYPQSNGQASGRVSKHLGLVLSFTQANQLRNFPIFMQVFGISVIRLSPDSWFDRTICQGLYDCFPLGLKFSMKNHVPLIPASRSLQRLTLKTPVHSPKVLIRID